MVGRKLASFARNGLGPAALLWIPTLYLLRQAFDPAPPWPVLAAILLAGLGVQGFLYVVANRGFFLGRRPPYQLRLAAAALAALSMGAAAGLPLLAHLRAGGAGIETNTGAASLAGAQLFALAYAVFARRVRFRTLVQFAEGARRRARSAARILLPVGTFHLDRVLRRLEELGEGAPGREARESPEREIRELVRELRVRWDDRLARPVPWATAAPLLGSFLDLLANRHGDRLEVAPLERRERLDHACVRASPACALLEAAAMHLPEDSRMAVCSSEEEGMLRLSVTASGFAEPAPLRLEGALLEEIRTSLRAGVRVSREWRGDTLLIDLRYPSAPSVPSEDDFALRFGPQIEPIAEGDPAVRKRLYRRGDEVIKVHFDGGFDPKPTLIDDEFYIMRRLCGHARWFPEITGTGRQPGYRWISYRYEPGTPLDLWLQRDSGRTHALHLLLDFQQLLRSLAELGVAHRDLNPGNLIVRPDQSLVLIDYDQAVADTPEFLGADLDGAPRGTAKNDLASLLDRAELTRSANDAVRVLGEHWPQPEAPFELELAGHLFPGREPFAPLFYALRDEVGTLAGLRVLDQGSAAPLFGLFAASHGARVTISSRDRAGAELASRLAGRMGISLEIQEGSCAPAGPRFDLVVSLEPEGAVSALDALPLERAGAVALTVSGDPASLARQGTARGFRAPRTLAFTSALTPLLLFERERASR
jgi:hypothetical protein